MSPVISKHPASLDSDEIDLGRLIGELIDHRKLIIFITAALTLLAVIYVLFATPVYQADALIQVEQKQGNAILESLSQVLPDSQPQSAPEIALLQSRMILGKTVDDLNLQAVVEQKYLPVFGRGWARLTGEKPGSLAVSHLYLPDNGSDAPTIVVSVVDKNNYLVEGDDFELKGVVGELLSEKGISLMVNDIQATPGTQFRVYYLTKLKAINNLLDAFNVSDQGKDTGILNLSLNGESPNHISAVLNSISQNYLDQNIARQAAQDAKSLDFLERQLPQVRADLNKSEDSLNTYRRQKDSVDLSLEAKSVLDQIVNVESQLNELTFREAEISQLYTKDHPTYKALLEKRQTLLKERDRLNKSVSEMPGTQQEVARLSRDAESNRAIYMQLLNRQQELSIAKSSAIGNVRIIDPAVTEPKAVKPKKVLIVLIGMILGAVISVSIVLLRLFLRKGIDSPELLEERGINVYASIPLSEWLSRKSKSAKYSPVKSKRKETETSFLVVENSADLAIEAIRSLRTSLHFAMMEAKNNVLMISGPSQNAGKTFVSSNLAVVIAQTNKKILFIDADMRKGYAHKLFKAGIEIGLSDILSGKSDPNSSAINIPSVGIDFISRGAVPPNPAELLMHRRFESLISWASENYDLVIIDTPPILAVTDAAIIGKYVGTTLLVARYGMNTVKEIEVSIRRFEQSGVQVKGCIINSVIKKASSYYGYGYSGYNYAYSDDK
ncbi:polysaccharide biosynthesis tyrosine autokinase [Rahnella bonaserana]|jgi:tyrosine-protein kinase Etk/Wzc|uniref:Polysaccharide biosynthesis tyrosine autokinase n=1 Tax=Rahnella bonaserana TaxID=2816248 RepID=A0ABS6LQ68_9GAMM|nr:polysaccharide biosynthesis tyrosine autokinase [Rahnella bonaserana]MBU9854265.1 polysaccharide biosynthesis tyrosine autokinase [Rahnella bonaserana]MCL9643179.1 polysaccharide biosynthesis tyrosine autokinase [Rahnella victoriana]